MRKHFLLLLLMTLLPLAGWATDVTVTLYDFTIPYGVEPSAATLKEQYPSAVKVDGATWDDIKGYLTFARVDDGSANWNSNNVGVYSWTLTKALNTGTYTIYLSSNNAKLTIEKADNAVTNTPTVDAGGAYKAAGYDLVATVPTVKFGTVKYNVTNSAVVPAANAAGWTTEEPHVTKPGTYYVYIMVDEDDVNGNYNALAPQKIAAANEVVIDGTDIPTAEYTLPTALGAAIPFDNEAHALATAGELVGEHEHCTGIVYSLNEVDWSPSVPTATAATGYTVYYKILGVEGWYDKAGSVAATISPAAPTVTSATAASDLVYKGEAQELLSKAGSASIGATPTYSVKYSATNLDDWGAVPPVAKATKADVKGTDAGFYQITTLVAAGGNYLAAAATPIVVQIATKPALTAAPTAKTGLVWNKNPQQLIVEGTGTVAGKVKYSLDNTNWTTDITTITGTNANDYNVWYKVDDPNYTAVASTLISDVKIAKKVLSVKVNNVKKTYDGTTGLFGTDDAALDGATEKFTFIGRIASDGLNFGTITYAAIDAANKNAGPHTNVLTIDPATLNAISTNYDYTIIPGTLTVEKKALTVTANQPLSAVYHTAYDISGEYTYSAFATGEDAANVFATAPVLTTNAAAENPEPADYTIAFTEGVLVANPNYTVTYVIPDNAKFTVTPDPASKIVITVLPKTYTYGETENYDLDEGTDYFVTGLIGDDVLTEAPTFSRSDANNKNVGTYELIAENAAVADPSKYPGGFVYNNSTVEIEKKEITVTVNTQTIVKGTDDEALAQLDQDAWSVDGLEYEDTKASLKGALANMLTPKATVAANEGTYNDGIEFAFNNANYKLAAAVTGKLIVLEAGTLILDCAKADNATKIAAQVDNIVNVSINFGVDTRAARKYSDSEADGHYNWIAEKWTTLVLPFDITVAELSQKFNYAIVNVINPSATTIDGTSSKFYGRMTMKGDLNTAKAFIPANTPILLKIADDLANINNGVIDFGSKKIIAPADEKDLTVNAGAGSKFVGTYTKRTVTKNDGAKVWFMNGNEDGWQYIGSESNASWDILPFEAYIDFSALQSAPENLTFFFEDLNGFTAIKNVNTENRNGKLNAEGWYTLDGVKLQDAPVKKGLYIKNGKKVVIK